MSAVAVKIHDLNYRYPQAAQASLKDIQLEIPAQSCTVILGPNGAGKSTLMSLICGLLPSAPGTIEFPAFAGSREFFSYGTQQISLYGDLTVQENMQLFARLMNPDVDPKAKIEELSRALDFSAFLLKRTAHCSGGIRQRVHVAISLMGTYPLVVLDEPFNNIDPESRVLIRDLLKKYLADNQATLILSSHQFEAMEDLWTHLVFIKHGTVSDFITRSGTDKQQKLQQIFFELKNAEGHPK